MLAGSFSIFWSLRLYKPIGVAQVAVGSFTTGKDLGCGKQNVKVISEQACVGLLHCVDIQPLYCWNRVTILSPGFKKYVSYFSLMCHLRLFKGERATAIGLI